MFSRSEQFSRSNVLLNDSHVLVGQVSFLLKKNEVNFIVVWRKKVSALLVRRSCYCSDFIQKHSSILSGLDYCNYQV